MGIIKFKKVFFQTKNSKTVQLLDNCTTIPSFPILEKLYAKVDKSRKSRISSSDETTLLTSVVINGGPTLSVHSEADPNQTVPENTNLDPDEVAFIDNDLYEKDL